MTPLQMVRQFHEAFGVPAYDTPRIPDKARRRLRRRLIREEYRAAEYLKGENYSPPNLKPLLGMGE